MRAPTAAAIAAAVLALGAPACGGDDGGGSEGSGALADALSAVSAGEQSEQRFSFTDVAAVRELAGAPATAQELELEQLGPWAAALGTGAPGLAEFVFALDEELRLDLVAADRTLSIGPGPVAAVRVDGTDGAAVADALRERGLEDAEAGGRETLARPGEPDLDDPLAPALLRLGARAAAEGETVVLAADDEALLAALGEAGEPLGDQPAFAAAAACLGDVVSAEIWAGPAIDVPDAETVAVGVRRGDAPTEVLCVVGDEGQAGQAGKALEERLTLEAPTPDTRQPLSALLEAIELDAGEAEDRSYARAVITPLDERPADFLQRSLAVGALAFYVGSG
ncbi:MAG TPA: hypothetical protein VIL49_15885 [Capillimicrobium sp.]